MKSALFPFQVYLCCRTCTLVDLRIIEDGVDHIRLARKQPDFPPLCPLPYVALFSSSCVALRRLLSPAGCSANSLYASRLCSYSCIAVQTEPPGSAVAWWFPATKGCHASPTCPLKPKTCGRSRGSRYSSSSVSGTGSLGRSGWVRIQSPPEEEAAWKGPQ